MSSYLRTKKFQHVGERAEISRDRNARTEMAGPKCPAPFTNISDMLTQTHTKVKQEAHSHLIQWQSILSIFYYMGVLKYYIIIKFIINPLIGLATKSSLKI